ncbi:hypothetical protein PanWU01x14_303240 [Parasponia andersonii]|uniref:Uncharacterized protein n=1 Tax=Parasponia andersonii TaxID=3476 RepID=A0A2P5AT14_PARAD|nr:hypothetical protein PanWU01x14_303240 [Parasponia andersonii]
MARGAWNNLGTYLVGGRRFYGCWTKALRRLIYKPTIDF